jgi:hypothetical protein
MNSVLINVGLVLVFVLTVIEMDRLRPARILITPAQLSAPKETTA